MWPAKIKAFCLDFQSSLNATNIVFRFSVFDSGFFVFFTHVRAIFANFEGRGLDCEFATFIVFKTLSNSLLCFCLFAIFYFALFCCLCFLQLPSAAIAISVLFYAQFVCPVCVCVCEYLCGWVAKKRGKIGKIGEMGCKLKQKK